MIESSDTTAQLVRWIVGELFETRAPTPNNPASATEGRSGSYNDEDHNATTTATALTICLLIVVFLIAFAGWNILKRSSPVHTGGEEAKGGTKKKKVHMRKSWELEDKTSLVSDCTSIAFSPNNKMFAYGEASGSDSVVMLGKIHNHVEINRFHRVKGKRIRAVAFSADNEYLATCQESTVDIWTIRKRITEGEEEDTGNTQGKPCCCKTIFSFSWWFPNRDEPRERKTAKESMESSMKRHEDLEQLISEAKESLLKDIEHPLSKNVRISKENLGVGERKLREAVRQQNETKHRVDAALETLNMKKEKFEELQTHAHAASKEAQEAKQRLGLHCHINLQHGSEIQTPASPKRQTIRHGSQKGTPTSPKTKRNSQLINCIGFTSIQGKNIFAAGFCDKVLIWKIPDKTQKGGDNEDEKTKPPLEINEGAKSLCFGKVEYQADEKLVLAILVQKGAEQGKSLHLWNIKLSSGFKKRLEVVPLKTEMRGPISFWNESTIVVKDRSSGVVYSLDKKEVIARLPAGLKALCPKNRMMVTSAQPKQKPNAKFCALGSLDKPRIEILRIPDTDHSRATFSPDGKYLVSCFKDFELWDLSQIESDYAAPKWPDTVTSVMLDVEGLDVPKKAQSMITKALQNIASMISAKVSRKQLKAHEKAGCVYMALPKERRSRSSIRSITSIVKYVSQKSEDEVDQFKRIAALAWIANIFGNADDETLDSNEAQQQDVHNSPAGCRQRKTHSTVGLIEDFNAEQKWSKGKGRDEKIVESKRERTTSDSTSHDTSRIEYLEDYTKRSNAKFQKPKTTGWSAFKQFRLLISSPVRVPYTNIEYIVKHLSRESDFEESKKFRQRFNSEFYTSKWYKCIETVRQFALLLLSLGTTAYLICFDLF